MDDDALGNGRRTVAVSAVVLSLATLFASGRVFCRIRMLDLLYADDWIILLSLVTGWTAFVLNVLAVESGLGQHMSALNSDQQSGVLLYTTAGFFPGILSFTLPKLAVISLLCRMLNPSRINRIFMWSMGALLMVNSVACFALLMGRCWPFEAVYDVTFPASEATCFSPWVLVAMAVYTTVCCAVADLYLAIYPSIVLSKLQINKKKKMALSVALGIGTISVIIAAYKATRLKAMAAQDFSYENADLNIWTIVEGSVVNISASIPLLKPLVDLFFGAGAMDSSHRSSNNRLGFRSDGLSRSKGGAIELKNTAHSSYGAKLSSSNAVINNKSRTNSMTMTRMIAKAAGDNESQESILDDSLCDGSGSNRSNNTTTTAQTKASMEEEEEETSSRPDSKLEFGGGDRQRFNQTMGSLTRSSPGVPPNEGGISCTTEIVVQYSKDESSDDQGLGQQRLDWR